MACRLAMKPSKRNFAQEVNGGRCARTSGRRGLMLIVVLAVVVLLSLLAAGFSFMVQANTRGAMAAHHQYQARMAAESGFQRAVAVLRISRNDPGAWFNNPALFRAVLLEGTEKEDQADTQQQLDQTTDTGWYDPTAEPAWRFSLFGRFDADPTIVRYGVTDETSKIDLNQVTEDQLYRFFERLIPQDATQPVDISVLVDSLLDWREGGRGPRPNGAKDEYYLNLKPPYRCKSARFSTIEELLLVRGFTAWVMFGEDYNRNGLLDPNENDGDASFPPDNGDGLLFVGIAPYLTLWSRELNVASDARPRINLNMQDTQKLQEQLVEFFDGDIVTYVMQVRASGATFNSVMNLFPAPPAPEGEEEQDLRGAAPFPPGPADPATSQPTTGPTEGIDAGSPEGSTDLSQSENGSEKPPEKPPEFKDLTADPPPGDLRILPLVLDRLTVDATPGFAGRVNATTAPAAVLATIDPLTDEEIDAIVAARADLTAEEMRTPAWLVTRGVLTEHKFRWILPRLALGSNVFQAECVGYADHLGVMSRFNVIFEMRGPVAQVLYKRDLDELGAAYRPHGEEIRGLSKGTTK